jgi:hypothetical protein
VDNHLGLVATLVAISLSLVRVFAVAAGDRATLLTLLSTLDVKAVLLGTFAWAMPTLVAVIAGVLWIRWLRRGRQARPAVPWAAVLVSAAALVLFALAPVNDLVNLVGCVVAVIVLRKPGRNRLGVALLVGAGFLIFFVGPVVFRGANMWLPAERIVLSADQALVGYVLATDSNEATLLVDAAPRIRRVPIEDIESRTVCRLNPTLESASLVAYLTGSAAQAAAPAC